MTISSRIFVPQAKRILDICVSSVLLVLLSPLLLLLAVVLRLRCGQPVLFRQVRPGRKEKLFVLYKLRTMADARNASGALLDDDQRLTALGKVLRKLSLDEIPQLWNVLKGDMSLVGPRPLLQEYLSRYSAFERRRHEVKPGITGWAQVNGRNALTWERKFELDVWYVEHQSLRLDLKILWITLLQVLRKDGISQDGHATMPEFMGSTHAVEQHE
ncbi:MAG: sugar transferase [Bryobacteraceae bacterium]